VPLEAVRVPVEAMQLFWRSRVLLKVIIGILEPKRVLVKAVRVFLKAVGVFVEALILLQRSKSVCRGPCDVNRIKGLDTVAEE
jgi:hypothetical protein